MLNYLRGVLIDKNPSEIVLDCNGIGYEISISLHLYESLPEINNETQIYVEQIVREDSLTIYGFSTKSEKDIFRKLIKVSGIGPKTAITIISAIPNNDLITAILNENHELLKKFPGIGDKTAKRLVIELKDKFNNVKLDNQSSNDGLQKNDLLNDAVLVLIQFGYTRQVSEKSVNKAFKENPSMDNLETVIRHSLNNLIR